jgi:hypothetical protein
MIRHDQLPPVHMAPFLVTAALTGEDEALFLQNLPDFSRAADREPPAHGSASSSTLAPCGNATSAGSNQSANASLALAIASASVSPALAHPGSSGNTADQRFAPESNSITRRSFTRLKHTGSGGFCTLQISAFRDARRPSSFEAIRESDARRGHASFDLAESDFRISSLLISELGNAPVRAVV